MTVGILMGNSAGMYNITATLTPTSVTSVTAPTQTFTVVGLKIGDVVTVNPPSQLAGVTLTAARVSAADTLALTFANPTAGNLVPSAGAYLISVVRPSGSSGSSTVIAD